eukprot:COSAG01_NODE_11947_length_1829_cov_1.338728_1_plen_217_part_10
MPGALRVAQRINRMSAPARWSQARMAEEAQAEAAAALSALEDAMNAAEHDDSSDSECRAKPEPDLEPEPEVEPIEVPATELEPPPPPPPPPQGMQDVHGEEVARIGRLPSVTEAGDGDGDGDGGARHRACGRILAAHASQVSSERAVSRQHSPIDHSPVPGVDLLHHLLTLAQDLQVLLTGRPVQPLGLGAQLRQVGRVHLPHANKTHHRCSYRCER